MNSTSDAEVFPDIALGDIVNYLVLSTNHVLLEQMKAYKALMKVLLLLCKLGVLIFVKKYWTHTSQVAVSRE